MRDRGVPPPATVRPCRDGFRRLEEARALEYHHELRSLQGESDRTTLPGRASCGIPFHVEVAPPEGGLTRPSAILWEAIRSVSVERLARHLGAVRPDTLGRVEQVLSTLLGFARPATPSA